VSFQVSPNFRKQSVCLFGLTVLNPAESKINENEEHTIFTWKTSSLTKVKNHDLTHVGFLLNPLNGLKTLKS